MFNLEETNMSETNKSTETKTKKLQVCSRLTNDIPYEKGEPVERKSDGKTGHIEWLNIAGEEFVTDYMVHWDGGENCTRALHNDLKRIHPLPLVTGGIVSKKIKQPKFKLGQIVYKPSKKTSKITDPNTGLTKNVTEPYIRKVEITGIQIIVTVKDGQTNTYVVRDDTDNGTWTEIEGNEIFSTERKAKKAIDEKKMYY